MNLDGLDIRSNAELKAEKEGRRDEVLLNQTGEDTETLSIKSGVSRAAFDGTIKEEQKHSKATAITTVNMCFKFDV